MNAPQDFNAVLEQLPISCIRPSPFKAQSIRRQHFSSAKMLELAASISANGVLQPILVRPMPISATVRYEIVAGERRYIAADRAGLAHIPATIRDMTDAQVLEAQLVENIQREGLHVLEEAEGYAELMKVGDLTAEQIGDKIGKSRSYVYARLKLLDLIPAARDALNKGDLDASKALILARIKGEKMQTRALKIITEQGEYYSYRRLMETLRQDTMIPIAQAPWLGRDTLHMPKGGEPCQQCDTCPTRSANDPELASEIDGADVCLDKACYELKTKLHWNRVKREYTEQGKTIISGEATKEYPTGKYDTVKGGYVRLTADCDSIEFTEDEPEQGKDESDEAFQARYNEWHRRMDEFELPTYAAVVGDLPDTQLVETPAGIIPMAPVASVVKALKVKKLDIPWHLKEAAKRKTTGDDDNDEPPRDPAREAAERAKEEERARVQTEYEMRLAKAIHAKYKGPLKLPELQAIAQDMQEGMSTDIFDEIYPDYVNVEKLKEPALLQMMITILIGRELENTDKPAFTLSLAQRLKIDVKKLRAEVVKDLKPVSAAPEAKTPAKGKAKKKAVKS